MAVNTKIYDEKFFTNTFKFESQSAKAFTQILIKHFAPKSVIDIGCGIGIYLAEFQTHQIEILGFDGSPAAVSGSLVGAKIKLHDLCLPLELNRQFDLCLCLEVAEHLAEICATTLVDTLINLSDSIIFTAATPGQGPGSMGHINEQPNGYWKKLFDQKNYILNKKLTGQIKKEMQNAKVVWWLVKNLMVFGKYETR